MELIKYQSLLDDIKSRIRSAQVRAALAVNSEMILLYWQIGKTIANRQAQEGWSSKVIPRLANDLKNEFAELKGYSERNLGRMLTFYKTYTDHSILPQLVAKLPWGHNILLIEKIKDPETRFWYVRQCLENGWNRDMLDFQIKSQLHKRKAKVISNFRNFYLTFPSVLSIRQTASAETEHSILRSTFSKLRPNTCPIYPPKRC